MRRASHSITLVLISASLFLHGCEDHSDVVITPDFPSNFAPDPLTSLPPNSGSIFGQPAGTDPTTLPGDASSYRYIPPYYYLRPANPTGSTSSSTYSPMRSTHSSFGSGWGSSWGSSSSSSGGWGSSSGSSHSSDSSHSSSVSRGGFGSSSHSFSGGHSSS